MAHIVNVDFETRSTVDLRKTGVYPYAAHSTTDLWCLAYVFDNEDAVGLWHPGLPFPERLAAHVHAGGELRAWNAQFERVIWREIGGPRYGFPTVALEQWVCTAAQAAAMALPRSLDAAASVLRLAMQKDAEGHRLMLQMCKPRRIDADGQPVWWDIPEKRERLYAYCQQDVRTERAVMQVLHPLSASERAIFHLDQTINDRGIMIDRPLVQAMQGLMEEGLERANADIKRLTSGSVDAVTKVGQIKDWLLLHGIVAPSLDKDHTKELLASTLTDRVREVIETRAEAGRSSVTKLKSLQVCAGADDVVRGTLLYCGAGTGRWSGRLIQPQNFPRPTLDAEIFIPEILAGRYDALNLFASPFEIVASLLRGTLRARPGRRLIAGDYSGIEARLTNWLAGQDDIVEMFRAGTDIYMHNARLMFHLGPEATKHSHPQERQAGKAVELGCGFGMGHKKFQATAAKAPYFLTIDLPTSKAYVDFYRGRHPYVVDYWRDLNDAALAAVATPGSVHVVGTVAPVKLVQHGGYLYLRLPSGRHLCYPRPRLRERPVPWDPTQTRPSVEVEGMDSQSRQWARYDLYGGILCENIVQAVARDLMAGGMLRVENAGYPVIFTVHDEVVADVPMAHGSVAEFGRLLEERPDWARSCPVNAEVWEGERYGK